jgi:hypothetical protein
VLRREFGKLVTLTLGAAAFGADSFFASFTGPDGPKKSPSVVIQERIEWWWTVTEDWHYSTEPECPKDLPLGCVKSPFSTPDLRALLNIESN